MWEWVQTSRPTSSTPKPAWARARSSWRSRPLPPMPVSKRTMPSPARHRPGVAVRHAGPGQRQPQPPDPRQLAVGAGGEILSRRRWPFVSPQMGRRLRRGGGWCGGGGRGGAGWPLELLQGAGDGKAERAAERPPVGDPDRQRVTGFGTDEGGDRGDHEQRRAEPVDAGHPPFEPLLPPGWPACCRQSWVRIPSWPETRKRTQPARFGDQTRRWLLGHRRGRRAGRRAG